MGQRLTPTRAVVEEYIDALNSHDADRIAACVAEQFVNEHTAVGGVDRHGRSAYRAALDRFLTDFAHLHYAPEQYIVDGARCAVPYRMTALLQGRPVDLRGVFVFAVDGQGRIERRTDYWDSAAVPRLG